MPCLLFKRSLTLCAFRQVRIRLGIHADPRFYDSKYRGHQHSFTEVTTFSPLEGIDPSQVYSDIEHPSYLEPNYPASFVTWSMAAFFSNQLTVLHNNQSNDSLTACYDCSGTGSQVSCELLGNPYECSGYRLATRAEWEFAARSGSTSDIWTENGGGAFIEADPLSLNCTEGTILDGFDTPLSDYAWYCLVAEDTDGFVYQTQVATLKPNAFGLYDMHGNIAEWSLDQELGVELSGENPYAYSVSSTARHFLLGGTASQPPVSLAVDRTIGHADGDRFSYLGFRVVRTLLD